MKKANKRSAEDAVEGAAAASPKTPSLERQRRQRKATEAAAMMPSMMPHVVVVQPSSLAPQPASSSSSSLPRPWTRESLSHAARTLAALEPQRLAPLIEKHGVPFEKLLPKTKKTTATTATTAKTEEEQANGDQNQNDQNQNHHHHHFATLARAIVGQQVSGAAAATIYARVLSVCLEGAGGGTGGAARAGGASASAAMPILTPESLLAVPLPALRAAGLSERKASYLVGLAERFLAPAGSNPPDSSSNPSSSTSSTSSSSLSLSQRLDELSEAGDAEAMISELVRIRGIGHWTAQMHLLFHAGGPDVLPTGDLGIKKGFARVFGGGGGGASGDADNKKHKKKSTSSSSSLPSENQMLSWAEPFRPYRSLLSYYLWRAASD